jgi:predicted nucleic acid-binding protein
VERQASLVVDASIAVKWLVPEADSLGALKIREAHAGREISLFAPDLLTYEVANALRYRSGLADNDIEEGIDSLFDLDLALIAPTPKSVSQAALLAKTMNTSIYDATYLVLARDLDCRFITSDNELYEKARNHDEDRAVLLKEYLAEQGEEKE